MEIFFNSSMPRAGSTLFQNLMAQNPYFYATPTSGVLELIYGAKHNFATSPEFKAQDSNLMENAFSEFCIKGMEGYFSAITDKPYVIDKSRGWGINYRFLNAISPNPKIICVVRDLRDIIASMEKIYRKNDALSTNPIVNHSEMKGTTLDKRVGIWLNTQPIGLALDRIRDIMNQEYASNILFVKYEDLLTKPNEVMGNVYRYLDIPYYQHDWSSIPQVTQEDDVVYGMYGDHKIQNTLADFSHNYNEVLGPEISNQIYQQNRWYFKYFGYRDL